MIDATEKILVVTTDEVAGRRIRRVYGLVRGSAVRGHDLGTDIISFLKNTIGGEIEEATTVLAQAREQALDRLIASARSLGANAVIGFRFTTAEVVSGAAEMIAYGTAVLLEPEAEDTSAP